MSHPAAGDSLGETRDRVHPDCVVCSRERAGGLRLEFARLPGGGVSSEFPCDAYYAGYPGYVHGGIVSSLLDGAMTNALFADGQVALTAELTVRFLEPLLIGEVALVTGRVVRSRPRLQETAAEVVQGGRTKAVARGKFIPHPDRALQEGKP